MDTTPSVCLQIFRACLVSCTCSSHARGVQPSTVWLPAHRSGPAPVHATSVPRPCCLSTQDSGVPARHVPQGLSRARAERTGGSPGHREHMQPCNQTASLCSLPELVYTTKHTLLYVQGMAKEGMSHRCKPG